MYSKGFLRSVLNLVVVVSLLVGLLPLKVRAASVTEEPTVEPSPQAPTADYEIYLPLVLRNYAGEMPEIALNQSAYPWLLLPGEFTTYTLVLENPESYVFESGALTAEVPEGLSPVEGSVSDAGVYDAQAQRVHWTLPEVAGSERLTMTFQAQVTASSPLTMTSLAQVTGTMKSTQVVTANDTIHLSVGEAVTETLTASGGTFTVPSSDVTLTAPSGSVTQTTQVRVAGFPVPFPRPAGHVESQWYSLFDVTAVGEAGQALFDAEGHTHFLQPLTISAQIPPTSLLPYLVHIAGPSVKDYERKIIDVPRTSTQLTVALQTFSPHGVVGVDDLPDQGTHYLMTNMPDVNLFSGAATYNYDLALPAGRRDLAPQLSLNYNSGALNGLAASVQSSDVGLGWSLGGRVEIVRDIRSNELCYDDECQVNWSYKNEFDLNIGGTKHELVRDEGWTGAGCRYYAENAPDMLVMRYTPPGDSEHQLCGYPEGGSAPPNVTKEYWEVTMSDGTVYRLGYYGRARNENPGGLDDQGRVRDSEQITRMDGYRGDVCSLESCDDPSTYWLSFLGYAGEAHSAVAYRWSVDFVRDVYSNTIEYGYRKEKLGVYCDGSVDLGRFDRAQHLDWIRYTGNAEQGTPGAYLVDFVLEARTKVNDNQGEGEPHDEGLDNRDSDYVNSPWAMWDSLRVDKIRVCANDSALECADSDPLWAEYDLDYQFIREIKPFSSSGPAHETTRLRTIIRRGRDAQGELVELPAPTFDYGNGGYASFPQFHGLTCANLRYPRLLSADNGYGGRVVFNYNTDHDERIILDEKYYSFRVKSKSVSDGMGHTSRTDYTYGDVCFYSGNRENSCDRSAPSTHGLGGHQSVTQTVYGYENELLTRSKKYFHATGKKAWRTGRAYRSEVYDTDGATLLQHTETEWVKERVGPTTFTYASVVTSTDHTASPPLVTHKEYIYDPGLQDGAQYGQLTQVREYDSQNVRQRITLHKYAVNPQAWVIVPVVAGTFDGAWGLRTASLKLYDGNTDADDQTPSRGALTLSRQILFDQWQGCPATYEMVDTSYSYDAYGNQTSQTTYEGYGENSCDADNNWGTAGAPGGGSASHVTTMSYDAQYHQFPVETCAAVDTDEEQCSGVEYYGVNGDASVCPISDGHFGAVCRAWNPNGSPDESTHYHYDAFGRKAKIWLAGSDVDEDPNQRIDYSDVLQPEWRPMEVSIWTRYNSEPSESFYDESSSLWQRVFYDGLGRKIQEHSRSADWEYLGGVVHEDGPGYDIVQDTHYNALGHVVAQSVPYSATRYIYDPDDPQNPYHPPELDRPQTLTDYDALGRPVQVTNPDGTATTMQYTGRTKTIVDANGHQTRQTMDDLGRMVQVEEFTGEAGVNATLYATTRYAYDILDNLTTVTDTVGNVTTMSYDGLGRKLAMSDPDMGDWSYTYSPAGNLETQTDARGCVISFAYDPLERLTSKSYGGAAGCAQPSVSYSYDEDGGYNIGMRTGMTYEGGSSSYDYDVRGRVVRSTQTLDGAGSYTTTYTYDELDRLASTTYPDGEVVETTYDNAGHPMSLSNQNAETYVENTIYNELGAPIEMSLGNGTQTTWAYWGLDVGSSSTDNFGRLAQIQVRDTTSSLLMDRQYDYDDVGNVTQQIDMVDNLSFTYDHLDRLVGVTGGYNADYEYNEIGNLTRKRVDATPWTTYTYPQTSQPQPHAVTELSDGSEFIYDANGNMTSRIEVSGTQPITYMQAYDAENRLKIVTNTVSGAVTHFLYDGDGARVAQVTDEGATVYVGEIYEEFHEAGSSVVTATKYYYLDSRRVAMRTPDGVTYLHGDHLGSTSLTTDESGAVVSKQRYYPYGDVRDATGTTPTDFGFTGQRADASTGLMYYRARYYDPTLGRFISADAIVPGAASGVGGGVTTLGYDRNTRLTPLTVNLGEFAEQIGAENREVLQFGAFFQWDSETRQEHNVPMGPANPQALNRYAYCLGNPLRYVDPTGYFQVELSAKEAAELMDILDQISEISLYQGIVGEIGAAALNFFGQKLLSDEFVALALGLSVPQTGLVLALSGISMMLTADDLNNIRIAMGDLGADETGAKISITPGVFGSQSTITTVEGRRTLKLRNLSLTGSAAPWIFGGMMIGYRAREWLFPNPKYSVYIPFVAR